MTQSNLNQAGLEAAAIAIRTTEISDVPYSHEYIANSEILAKAAIAAYLECVEQEREIEVDKDK